MIEKEIDELLSEDLGEDEYVPLDMTVVRANIPTYSSQKLCEMVVCDRYFGCYRDIAIMCMTELATRRTNGDDFQFEKIIDNEYKKLPQLNFNSFDIRDVLKQAMGTAK
jgi:hypothetical protein